MGEQSFVSRKYTDKAVRSRRRVALDIDVILLLTVATLLVFGLIMVYSASWDFSYILYNNASRIILRQMLFVAVGVGIACGL